MTYFAWSDDLSVGNTLLDHDHKQLINLVNQLHTATSRGEGRNVVGSILAALILYTNEHFQREEFHMAQMGYPGLPTHQAQHRKLLATVVEMQSRFDDGQVTVATQVSAVLRDWLSIHILHDDKAWMRLGQGRVSTP